MGYELNRLMKQYGVSTPTMAGYAGTAAPGPAPTAPTAPVLAENATREQRNQYNKDLEAFNTAQDKYSKDKAAFDEQMRKYQLDTKSYDQYAKAYQDRLANTNMYNQAQFSTTGANVPGTMTFTAQPDGATKAERVTQQTGTQYGTPQWASAVKGTTYGAVPLSVGQMTPEEKAQYYLEQRGIGYTDADLRAATTKTFGAPKESDWTELLNRAYPQFTDPVKAAYANIGRTGGFGSNITDIDNPGYNYWVNQLSTGAVKPEDLNQAIYNAANTWMPNLSYDASQLPKDFNWGYYVNKYPDLYKAGIDTQFEAARHYFNYGQKEGRSPYEGWTAPTVTIPTTPTGPSILGTTGGTTGVTMGGGTTTNNSTFNTDQTTPVTYDDYGTPIYYRGGGGRDLYNDTVQLYAEGGSVNSDVNRLDDNMRNMLGKYDLGMTWGINPDESYGFHQMYESNPVTEKFISQPYGDYVGVRVKQDDEGNAVYIPMYTGVVPEKEEPKDLGPQWGENSDGSYGFYRYAHGGAVKTHYQDGGRTMLGYDSPETEADWMQYWASKQSPVETFPVPSEGSPEVAAAAAPVAPLTVVANEQAAPVEPLPPPPVTTPATPAQTPPATDTAAAAPVLDARTAGLQSLLERYGPQEGGYAKEVAEARKRAQAETTAFTNMLEKMMNSPEDERTSKAEMYFRLAAAFGSPTKTGQFTENLALAGKELGEYAKGKRESSAKKRDLMLEVQKMKMGAAKDDLAAVRALEAEAMKDRRAIAQELIKEYIASGKPQSDAGKQAMDMGLRPGTPEYQAKVQELAEFNVSRQMAGINNQLAQLTLAQANLTLRQQQAARLSPTEIKMLSEGEDLVASGKQALADLKEAYRLNPNSLAGGWLEKGQQFLFEAAGSNDPTIVNTRVINNLLGAQGLAKLRATFGGNPTEGERAILLELEGIGSKTREERATIVRRAYRVLQDRVAREQQRVDALKSGAYRVTEPLTTGEQ